DFLKQQEILSEGESKDFEKFCNYSILKKEYSDSFETEDLFTGDSTQGIDGLALIINGKLISNKEEIDDLLDINKYIEAKFIFIQAKTSESFNSTDIGNF